MRNVIIVFTVLIVTAIIGWNLSNDEVTNASVAVNPAFKEKVKELTKVAKEVGSKTEGVVKDAAKDTVSMVKEAVSETEQLVEAAKKLVPTIIDTGKGKKISLEKIYFHSGKADIKEESHGVLVELASFIKAKPNEIKQIIVEGHTDDSGDPSFNQSLSYQRADKVIQFLVEQGVSDDALIPKGFGSAVPLVENDGAENKAVNRRVEFRIVE